MKTEYFYKIMVNMGELVWLRILRKWNTLFFKYVVKTVISFPFSIIETSLNKKKPKPGEALKHPE